MMSLPEWFEPYALGLYFSTSKSSLLASWLMVRGGGSVEGDPRFHWGTLTTIDTVNIINIWGQWLVGEG